MDLIGGPGAAPTGGPPPSQNFKRSPQFCPSSSPPTKKPSPTVRAAPGPCVPPGDALRLPVALVSESPAARPEGKPMTEHAALFQPPTKSFMHDLQLGRASSIDSQRSEDARSDCVTADGLPRKEWTAEDDKIIFDAVASFGLKWRQIAAMLPGRSDDAVRNRWNRIKSGPTTSGPTVYHCSKCGQVKKNHRCQVPNEDAAVAGALIKLEDKKPKQARPRSPHALAASPAARTPCIRMRHALRHTHGREALRARVAPLPLPRKPAAAPPLSPSVAPLASPHCSPSPRPRTGASRVDDSRGRADHPLRRRVRLPLAVGRPAHPWPHGARDPQPLAPVADDGKGRRGGGECAVAAAASAVPGGSIPRRWHRRAVSSPATPAAPVAIHAVRATAAASLAAAAAAAAATTSAIAATAATATVATAATAAHFLAAASSAFGTWPTAGRGTAGSDTASPAGAATQRA